MIFIGTSGFSYADWKGIFYPAALQARDMLDFYARHFTACEINSTYYRLPSPAAMASLVGKSKGRVTFVIKMHQHMTHQRQAGGAEYRALTEALKPLHNAGVLGGLLAQFPYSFTNTLEHRGYIADMKSKIPAWSPLVVEFRHSSWVKEDLLPQLKSLAIGVVNVDEPELKGLLRPAEMVSGAVGYVRFHGRNREKWFKRGIQPWERYDYLYSAEELQTWVPRIKNIAAAAENTFVFFNNHWQSQAVTNARQMAELLDLTPVQNEQQDRNPPLPFI
ncbi:DUF72 domain-containing protein [candidate division FCPU426 bacterium]|nr:DUF72 domain-containing protein [candidate division FCPU426 bacterium]